MAVPQTTLAAAITTTNATTATASDVLGFAGSTETDDLVLVDSEYMLVAGGLGTTAWTSITRGYASSTAATHLIGATVTRIIRSWTDITRVKTRTGLTDTVDDGVLAQIIDAVNAELTKQVGLFLGPSTDTTRTMDGFDAVRDGQRLWIPGGVRTVTAMTIASTTSASKTAATATAYRLGPPSWRLRTGQPYLYIEFYDVTTGNWSYFPEAYDNILITGTFGYASPPDDLQLLADDLAVRKWKTRDTGSTVGSGTFGTMDVYDLLTGPELGLIETYRSETIERAYVR